VSDGGSNWLSGDCGDADAKSVARRVGQIELGAEVALGGLDGLVAERELDLLERRLAGAGELGERAPQIVRRQVPAELTRVGADNIRDGVRGHPPRSYLPMIFAGQPKKLPHDSESSPRCPRTTSVGRDHKPAVEGHSRRPVWRRNAKHSGASLLTRRSPFVAASDTWPMVSAHRLANSLDFTLPHTCSMGLRSGA
jgi:hypothetical protein